MPFRFSAFTFFAFAAVLVASLSPSAHGFPPPVCSRSRLQALRPLSVPRRLVAQHARFLCGSPEHILEPEAGDADSSRNYAKKTIGTERNCSDGNNMATISGRSSQRRARVDSGSNAKSGEGSVLAPNKPTIESVILREEDLEERFVKGTGCGGQKINTTANRVQLRHIPTGITVSCQDARDLDTNRKWARAHLREKLDLHLHGDASKLGQQMIKAKKRKRDASRKSKKKYSSTTGELGESVADAKAEEEQEIAQILATLNLRSSE